MLPWKLTKSQIAAAYGQIVPDVIAPGLHAMFSAASIPAA